MLKKQAVPARIIRVKLSTPSIATAYKPWRQNMLPLAAWAIRFIQLVNIAVEYSVAGCKGPIAQLVEPPAHNRLVPGSSPGGPTKI